MEVTMIDLPENMPVRRKDGSLDIAFYSRRAIDERVHRQRLALADAVLLARRLVARLQGVSPSDDFSKTSRHRERSRPNVAA